MFYLSIIFLDIPPPIFYSSFLLYSSLLTFILTMMGYVPKFPASIAIPPPVHLHYIRVSSGSPYPLSLFPHYHCIHSLHPFYWSRPCCYLLRRCLPSLATLRVIANSVFASISELLLVSSFPSTFLLLSCSPSNFY